MPTAQERESAPAGASVRVIGRYAVYDAIASGGMATVHLGRLLGPAGFSRTVAIKRLHAQYARDTGFVSMFLDEARLAARIHHPSVVATLDVVAQDGELLLVMEYVPGESLARLVRTVSQQKHLVPPRVAVAVMAGVLRGLHAAHDATNEQGEPLGIVHRDVSPQNILVGTDGQARVLDFGVAKAVGRLQTTEDGTLKGKLAYMSPEQVRGEKVDRRSDVFAASVVLWETLTAKRLFQGDSAGAIVTKLLEGVAPLPSSVIARTQADEADLALVRAADDVVMRGLAADQNQRFASCREMALALERAVPPSGVGEVSDWVAEVARDVLASRARHVAEIESKSATPRPSVQTIRQVAGIEPDLATLVDEAARPPQAATPRWIWGVVPVMVLALTVAVLASRRTSEPKDDAPHPSASYVGAPAVSTSVPVSPDVEPPISPAPPGAGFNCRVVARYDRDGNKHFAKECDESGAPPTPARSSFTPGASGRGMVEAGQVIVLGGGVSARPITLVVVSALDKIADCYAKSTTGDLPEGTWNLRIATDDSGNVVDGRLDGPLPEPAKNCVQEVMMRKNIPADTGAVNATVELTFKRRVP